ncbi:MAG: serine/threonine protein kinase [Bacteroidota bacterium]
MIGQQILNYRIEKLIGEGGMGNVYLAVHTHIGRKVAIKALNPTLARNPEIRERFKNEASMLSQLHHPGIVSLYDYVELDSGVFLVMELAEGKPIDEYIQTVTGPIPEEKAIPLFAQILDGVAYAHHRNVVHRDIKPSNIIITPEGKAKILDFGIAKIISESSHKLTKTGTKLGTVLYMSPEQVKGQEVDKRSDIYSLGITLFQMLTGKCPFDENQSEYEVYKKIVEEPLPEARNYYPGVTDRMQQILVKATAKDVNDRFQTCEEFREAVMGKQTPVNKPAQSTVQTQIKTKNLKPAKTKRKSGALLFWNIFMAALLSLAVVIAIIQLASGGKEMYVLSHALWLRSTQNNTSNENLVQKCTFGEKVVILEDTKYTDDKGQKWVKIKTANGKEGYVAVNYLGTLEEYDQISSIFDDDAQKQTPVLYKKAVREYLDSHRFFDKTGSPEWKVYPESNGSEYNTYCSADFNSDSISDYACLLENTGRNNYRLLAYISTDNNYTILKMDEAFSSPVLIKFISKGTKLFTGKYTVDYRYGLFGGVTEVKKKVYDVLENDGIMLWYKDTGYKYLYTFDIRNESFNKPIDCTQ